MLLTVIFLKCRGTVLLSKVLRLARGLILSFVQGLEGRQYKLVSAVTFLRQQPWVLKRDKRACFLPSIPGQC